MLTIQLNTNPISYKSHLPGVNEQSSLSNICISEISKTASDAVSNIQRAIISINSVPPLDKTSDAAKFFGVDSRENVNNQIVNQLCLTVLKTIEEDIINFPTTSINDLILGKNLEKLEKPISAFIEKGIARWTLYNSYGDLHTIGMVKDGNNIYVLDSLGCLYNDMETPRKALSELFEENVIFSTKFQQKNDEYSCNNWTHANIDAVLKAIREGRLNPSNLDSILPNDINKILFKQKDYVEENIDSERTLLSLYREHKTNFY